MAASHRFLLLSLLFFAASVPSGQSLCDISAVRLEAHQSGSCEEVDPKDERPTTLAMKAAEQADVIEPQVVEAYKCSQVPSSQEIFKASVTDGDIRLIRYGHGSPWAL